MDFTKYFTLSYRLKTHPQQKIYLFKFEGKPGDTEQLRLQGAIVRGQKFCYNMEYIFVSVYPMISDLDKIENRFLNRSAVYQPLITETAELAK